MITCSRGARPRSELFSGIEAPRLTSTSDPFSFDPSVVSACQAFTSQLQNDEGLVGILIQSRVNQLLKNARK